MELSCSVRLVAIFVRNSFKHPVVSNIFLGIKARDPLEPLLVLLTSDMVIEFRVTGNVKRIYKKEIDEGRVGIEFHAPPHQLLISTDKSELRPFLDLLYKLMDRGVMEKLEYIPVLRQFSWRNSKTKSKSEPVYCSTCDSPPSDSMCKKPKINEIPLNLRERLSKHLKEIDLPDCKLKDIPVELGEISAELINLENNELTYENLSWLEGLPIRKSLKSLNLAENKINRFPAALIDFQSLTNLNFRDNMIEFIPGGIDQLRCLKYLNLSGNHLQYLPANFNALKLSEVDLTYNCLTNNVRSEYHPPVRGASKNCLRLCDLAALKVESSIRRELTPRLYPKSLLDGLRNLSRCVCGASTVPQSEAQFYEMLFRIKFALIYKVHPQKNDFTSSGLYGIRHKGNGRGNIFLQFHFCSKCEDEYLQYCIDSELCCYRLSQ